MKAGDISINISFINKVQEDFYYCTKRNQCFSGGFGNGKSYGASEKGLTLLTTFPRYRCAISRYTSSDLNKSTMSTFFKICPSELYNEAYGGRRNDRDGYLRLINGSEVFWIHLDDYSETSLRGLEVNSHIGDQMEEVAESVYLTIDSRIERWDQVEIPSHLNPERFSLNPYTQRPQPPCYNMVLCNPDSILHWIWRRYHPDSPEYARYSKNHAYFTASIHDNPAIPQSLKDAMLSRDKAWVDRFYWGKWGVSGGSIHYISDLSKIEVNPTSSLCAIDASEVGYDAEGVRHLSEVIKRDGIKFRVMDHGEAAPTVCLWFAYLSKEILNANFKKGNKEFVNGVHICYREYYQPEKLIKYHREAIASLSGDERYYGNFADPAIFKKTSQKYGGFWCTADDYLDYKGYSAEQRIKAPAIHWNPADNNEMSTRDAVSELLALEPLTMHPLTLESNAPSLYFIMKDEQNYPHGISHAYNQTQSQRRKKIGTLNGLDVYSDERDTNVTDHAYDPVRYYAIMPKITKLPDKPRHEPQFSFGRHMRKVNRFRSRGGILYGR